MQKVFVLDTNKQPLQPCHPARARQLLRDGKAAVYRRYPFTIILKREISEPDSQPLRLKIDPGSKTTGIAIVNDDTGEVVFAAEIQHRGQQIKTALDSRRAVRRSRRNRKTRYRPPRFNNRRRPEGRKKKEILATESHRFSQKKRKKEKEFNFFLIFFLLCFFCEVLWLIKLVAAVIDEPRLQYRDLGRSIAEVLSYHSFQCRISQI